MISFFLSKKKVKLKVFFVKNKSSFTVLFIVNYV